MPEWDGVERRQHRECNPDDYVKHAEHEKLCKVEEVKTFLNRAVWGVILGLFGIAGWLIVNGGFAKSSDLVEIKHGVMRLENKIEVMSEKQIQFEKRYEELSGHNNQLLRRLERMNGK